MLYRQFCQIRLNIYRITIYYYHIALIILCKSIFYLIHSSYQTCLFRPLWGWHFVVVHPDGRCPFLMDVRLTAGIVNSAGSIPRRSLIYWNRASPCLMRIPESRSAKQGRHRLDRGTARRSIEENFYDIYSRNDMYS